MESVIDQWLISMPSSLTGYLVHILVAIIICIPVFSITEIIAHGYLMHKKLFPPVIHRMFTKIEDFYKRHEVRHHIQYYRQFDYEPDPIGKHENLRFHVSHIIVIALLLAPFAIVLLHLSVVAAVTFVSCCILHNLIWSAVHTQMHIPKDVFWRDWAYYRLLARHHFMHHQDPGKNFNIVIPLVDFIVGTYKKPGFGDIREMIRLGYVKPKTIRIKKIVKKLQPRPAYAYDSHAITTGKY